MPTMESRQHAYRFAFEAAGSDKTGHHHYWKTYPRWLDPLFASSSTNVLIELGYACVTSARAWATLFPSARIIMVNVTDVRAQQDKVTHTWPDDVKRRITWLRQDLTDEGGVARTKEALQAATEGCSVQCIIDNATHVPAHQHECLRQLWSLLTPNGVYAVEAVETSFWDSHRKLHAYRVGEGSFPSTAAHTLAWMPLREFLPARDKETLATQDLPLDVGETSFSYNCIFLRKQDAEERARSDRRYRFRKFQEPRRSYLPWTAAF
jgi:hypothetical protein